MTIALPSPSPLVSRSAILFRNGLAPAQAKASLLCARPHATWVVHDVHSLTAALCAADAARGEGRVAVFALDYEVGALLEPAVPALEYAEAYAEGERPALGYVWIFSESHWLTRSEADAWLAPSENAAPSGCLRGDPLWDETTYRKKIDAIRSAIAEGDVYQVNLTFPIDVTIYGDAARAFLNLARAQPTAHAVYVDMPERQALSLSPELFFTVDHDQIKVRPMKGTASRLNDPEQDQQQAAALQASQKNRAENLMIVDLLRNDLGRVAVPGSIHVDALFEIEAYPTVHQMTSTVSAQLRTRRLEDLLFGLFPCGSVTGAPKVAAMQKIRALEDGPRGLYTGCIGWALGDRVEANVAIRTVVLDLPNGSVAGHAPPHAAGMRRASLGIGSGIVWDSDPVDEYGECLLKSDFLVKPDPGFTLFETLRLELPSEDMADTLPLVEVFPHVRRHQSRMARSAAATGFAFDALAFEDCLWQLKAALRQTQSVGSRGRVFRVRVDLTHEGSLKARWAPLPPIEDRVALIWSAGRLQAEDPLLRHKTSRRQNYDAAIEQATAQQAFDAIFCNESGEVCEGARSNIFVREGQRLLTPPVRCGLLPGVLRGALIECGEASEAVLTVADIKAASREGRLRVGNALRGLMPAYLK